MKVAILTDSHAGVKNDSLAFHDYMKKFYDYFFEYIDANNITTVIHCGDIIDRRKYINIYTAFRLRKDLIDPAMQRNIKWHQILGNHDVSFKNTNDVSSFRELFHAYPLNIYDQATEINIDGIDILLLPWINEENRDHALKLIKETNAQICFGHLEIQGFEMYKGSPMSHGEDPRMFERFDFVASGHYHHRSSRGNINYLGSAAEYTWSDYDDPRGFNIFDTETRKLKFIQNPYKMFYKFWYNDEKQDFIEQDIDYTQFVNKCVKVIIQSKTNPYFFETFIDKVQKQNPVDLQVVEDHLNLGLEDDQEIIDEAESTLQIFKNYINNVDAKGVDKIKLENKINELYHEALTLES